MGKNTSSSPESTPRTGVDWERTVLGQSPNSETLGAIERLADVCRAGGPDRDEALEILHEASQVRQTGNRAHAGVAMAELAISGDSELAAAATERILATCEGEGRAASEMIDRTGRIVCRAAEPEAERVMAYLLSIVRDPKQPHWVEAAQATADIRASKYPHLARQAVDAMETIIRDYQGAPSAKAYSYICYRGSDPVPEVAAEIERIRDTYKDKAAQGS